MKSFPPRALINRPVGGRMDGCGCLVELVINCEAIHEACAAYQIGDAARTESGREVSKHFQERTIQALVKT